MSEFESNGRRSVLRGLISSLCLAAPLLPESKVYRGEIIHVYRKFSDKNKQFFNCKIIFHGLSDTEPYQLGGNNLLFQDTVITKAQFENG